MAGVGHSTRRLGDIHMHVAEAGAGPTIVLLHGFPDFWYGWRHQIAPLAATGLRVLAPDLRGYGDTSKPSRVSDYTMDRLVGDVVALIEDAGGAPVTLAGHDWGGVIAWGTAARRPDLVRRLLVLNAPHPAAYARELRQPRQIVRAWYTLFFQLPWLPERMLAADGAAAIGGILRRSVSKRGSLDRAETRRYRALFAEPAALRGPIAYYRAAAREMLGRDGRTGSAHIRVPTRVIWGEQDAALDVRLLDGLERWVDQLEIVRLPGAGHFVHWDERERVSELMAEFAHG